MKRIYITAAIVLPLLLAGCEKETPGKSGITPIGTSPDTTFTITADVLAETVENIDGKVLEWMKKDSISFFGIGNDNIKMTLKGDPKGLSATFSGRGAGLFSGTSYYAISPYRSSSDWSDDDGISGVFPAEQTNDRIYAIRVAKAERETTSTVKLDFRNAFTVLGITLTGNGEEITEVTFSGNNDETVAGAFSISDFQNPVPTFSGTDKEILLAFEEPLALSSEPATIFMAVPNISYENGFSLHFKTNSAEGIYMDIETEGPVSLSAKTAYTITREFEGVVPEFKYEWSTGYLTVDENGYRFTDTDRPEGTETTGMFFRYNSAYAIESVFREIDEEYAIIWSYNEEKDQYEKSTVLWSELSTEDAGDPCSRVPVQDGEDTWKMPTYDQWHEWAYKTTTYNAQRSFNQQDAHREGVYSTFDIDPSDEGEKLMYLFASGYIASSGGTTGNVYNTMWVASDAGLVSGTELTYIQFRPDVASNGSNPAYRPYNVPSTLATQGHQIRCIRRVLPGSSQN